MTGEVSVSIPVVISLAAPSSFVTGEVSVSIPVVISLAAPSSFVTGAVCLYTCCYFPSCTKQFCDR